MNRRSFLQIALTAAAGLGFSKQQLAKAAMSEPYRVLWLDAEHTAGLIPFRFGDPGKQVLRFPGAYAVLGSLSLCSTGSGVFLLGCAGGVLDATPFPQAGCFRRHYDGRIIVPHNMPLTVELKTQERMELEGAISFQVLKGAFVDA